MKKNFFKKLALVMALTLTVTSVPATSASAAAAPGFKSKAVNVKVGETKKYSTANTTKYSVSFKIGNKSVATIATSGKAVKVTGVAAGATTLKATFKSYATKKVTTAKVPVTVTEEATVVKSVEAKGVKTLVVTFNKAVDTTKAVVAVKKGTTAPSITSTTWADDKKSVTVVMGSKLTEGTYTASVTGLTEAALTGSVTVKDETLTSIEIVGTNLVANATTASTATIAFKTLNQYGERMTVTNPNVSSSFGTAAVSKSCTATTTGIIEVTGIISTLQVVGTTGSVTVVDTTKGVNASATVSYSAAASAKTMKIAGLYNTSDSKFEDITKGDTISDYVMLATIQDQYGNTLVANQLTGKVTTNPVAGGGVTGSGSWTDKTVDGKDYVALSLTGTTATTGTFYFTFVNPTLGLLANTSFTVNAGTVLKSLNISANDTLYEAQDNELAFEAVDTNGNAVTKYSTLTGLVTFSLPAEVKFVKQADGSAKLIYNPTATLATNGSVKTSAIHAFTASVNSSASTSFFVKSLTFTTYAKRVAKAVTGLKAGTATAIASGQSIRLYATDLVVEDQYSNVMSKAEVKALANLNVATSVSDSPVVGNITTSAATIPTNSYVTLTAGSAVTETTIKLGVGNTTDYTVTYSTVDPTKASNLVIKSVKDGYVVDAKNATPALTTADVVVTGTVAGKTVVIPASQYVVSGNSSYALSTSTKPETSEKGTLEVTVDTANGPVVLTKEFTFANTTVALTTIEVNDTNTLTNGTITATQLATLFTMKDQYGVAFSGAGVKYDLVDVTGDSVKRTISHNSTNDVTVTAAAGAKFTVTATKGTLTATKTITLN